MYQAQALGAVCLHARHECHFLCGGQIELQCAADLPVGDIDALPAEQGRMNHIIGKWQLKAT